jgi:hypothetical protein
MLEQAVRKLSSTGASMRCADLSRILEGLGFRVGEGKSPGHKVFTHPHIPGFYTGSYNCGHGRNPQVKRAYITKVLRTLRQFEAELSNYLESRND